MSTDSELPLDRGEWTGTTALHLTITGDQSSGEVYGASETVSVELSQSRYRTASVSTDSNGDPLPIVIVAGPEELAESGIDLRTIDEVRYRWVDGQLVVRSGD